MDATGDMRAFVRVVVGALQFAHSGELCLDILSVVSPHTDP